MLLAPLSAAAQAHPSAAPVRPIPACGAMLCETEHLLTIALDAVLTERKDCQRAAPLVLDLLYFAPSVERVVPAGPPVARARELSIALFSRYWREISVVDSAAVLAVLDTPGPSCILVFSPPLASLPGTIRVQVAVWSRQDGLARGEQLFVRIASVDGVWSAVRVEYGWR